MNKPPFVSFKAPAPANQTLFRSRIDGINLALGGGFRRGEATLIAGRTGGGKTILACQFAFELGASGAHVALFSTEGAARDLVPRFISNATSTNVACLRPNTDEEYQAMLRRLETGPQTKNAMAQLHHVLDANVRIMECHPEKYYPMGQLLSEGIRHLAESRFTPDVLIYDWLGSNESLGARDAFETRRRYKDSADSFASCCQRNGFAGIIFCQLAMGLVGGKTTSIQQHMVAEAKNMTEQMANFIGISSVRVPMEGPQRRQYLCVEPRNRSAQNVPVERQFEYQRFAGI